MGSILDECCGNESRTEDVEEIESLLQTPSDKKQLCVSILTYNVGTSYPQSSTSKLFSHHNFTADIVVVGLQEVIKLNATSMMVDKNDNADAEWKNKVLQMLNSGNNKYELLEMGDLIGILLLVFVRDSIRSEIENVIWRDCKTGFGGMGGNKGAVGIRFDIYDTNMCFVCGHFAAHKSEVKARNENYHKILSELTFSKATSGGSYSDDSKMDSENISILDHKCVFMFGDLNYRLQYKEEELQRVYELVKKQKWSQLVFNDQLMNARQNGDAFDGFEESDINFQPTFKFEPGTDDYEQKKKRMPAYCDRVLWRVNKRHKVKCIKYDCYMEQRMSDHKPVVGLYQIEI